MKTLDQIMTCHDVQIPEHLEAQAEVPVMTELQRQGDLIIVPQRRGELGEQVKPEGVAVIRGENGGNTHLLVADGEAFWRSLTDDRGGNLGVVTVTDGTAYLLHPEHGANAMGSGSYLVRRQREQADEIRYVAD